MSSFNNKEKRIMENLVDFVAAKYLKKDVTKFNIGDTVDIQLKIVEEGKSRLQMFEGIVIARAGSGLGESFTVRKISYGEGVEMVIPLNSPSVEKIKVAKKGDARRAKLYYLKRKVGKESKIEEKVEHAKVEKAPAPRAEPE